MIKSAIPFGTPRRATAGFSLIELVMSICVMLILTALAVPSLMRSMRSYQLNSAATSVSDMLKFTRFEAVRRNTQLNLQFTQSGPAWLVWTDSFAAGNGGPIDPRDKQQVIAGYPTLLPYGVAPSLSPSTISPSLSGTALNTLSGANGSVTFDARGAILGIGGVISTSIYVFYVGNANDSVSGYRAVVLLPSGSTQIWTWKPPSGPWLKVG